MTMARGRSRPFESTWAPSPWLTQPANPAHPPISAEARWSRRPVASALVRFVVLTIPILASVLTAMVLSRLLPVPTGVTMLVAWWVVTLVGSTAVLVAVERLARRMLPLAVLLNLSMAFPDKAPDRFWIAFRAGTIRHLEQRLVEARNQGSHGQPSKAAATIITLVSAITAHDRRTRGHSERVRAFNDLIAEEMHLPEGDRERLRWAALLHDVGKLRTSPRILNKPATPSPAEWEELRRHPEEGARITTALRPWLGPWAAAIEQHHERWDGTGYPNGLASEQINLGARIVAVADAYEVMTSPRPYRRAVSARAAREELARDAAGAQFDPAVVRAFLTISIGKLRRVVGPIAWLLQTPFLASMSRLEVAVIAGRQLAATAGTATAVGVLAVSGVINTPPSTPAASSPAAHSATQPAAPVSKTAGAVTTEAPVLPPASPVTPPNAAAPPSPASRVPPTGEGQGPDRAGAPGRGPRLTVPDPSSVGSGTGVTLPARPRNPVTMPPLPVEPPAMPVDVPAGSVGAPR